MPWRSKTCLSAVKLFALAARRASKRITIIAAHHEHSQHHVTAKPYRVTPPDAVVDGDAALGRFGLIPQVDDAPLTVRQHLDTVEIAPCFVRIGGHPVFGR
jgi:hypothetical protein